VERLVDGLLDWEEVAIDRLAGALPSGVDVTGWVLHVQVITHACLAQWYLMRHAKRVNHLVVLIAVEHTCLLHLRYHLRLLLLWGRRLTEVLWRHMLGRLGVLVLHVLGEMAVMHPGLALARAVPDLPISCCLIHIVTHL
jgi:hypothetical protein